jgi:hypothetical protein
VRRDLPGAIVLPIIPARLPLSLRPVDWDHVDWAELERYPDRTLFQSRAWLEFVARTQRAEPLIVELVQGSEVVGHYTGLLMRRAGFCISGSPFKGWTTSYMGVNSRDEAVRDEALRQLPAFLFRRYRCAHVELMDRQVGIARAQSLDLKYSRFLTYELDLAPPEPELLAHMHSSVRRYIGRAERQQNVLIEESQDLGFADDYYAQLKEVFGRQGLVPPYGIDRVRALIDCLLPTGDLLLLRARDRAGRCLATGIFPARNGTMYFWGGASCQSTLGEHPNEPLQWHAMRYWKRRGMNCYDMGGGGRYKASYGSHPRELAWIRQSRSPLIAQLRNLASRLFQVKQRAGYWSGRFTPFLTSPPCDPNCLHVHPVAPGPTYEQDRSGSPP